MELDAQDLEFFYREAEKAFLERKRERMVEMRMAYHADKELMDQEFDQIKWGLMSIEKKDWLRERDRKERKNKTKGN